MKKELVHRRHIVKHIRCLYPVTIHTDYNTIIQFDKANIEYT